MRLSTGPVGPARTLEDRLRGHHTGTRPVHSSQGAPTATTLVATVGELVAALATAGVVNLALQWVINRLPLRWPSELPTVLIMLMGTATVVLIVGMVLVRRWPWCFVPLSWAALSAVVTVPLSAVLNGTRYYIGGLTGDQTLRTEYLTRLTDSAGLADMAYLDLPPFYPAGWFWLGGRFANAFGLSGWAAYKPWAILTMASAGVVAFVLWRVSVGPRAALALSTTVVVGGLVPGVWEPYAWLVGVAIPPLAVLAWRVLASVARGHRPGAAPALAIGLVLGVMGCLYTLYFVLAGLVLAVLTGWVLAQQLRRGVSSGDFLLRVLGQAGLVAGPAVAILGLVWGPYAAAVVGGAPTSAAARRFLPPSGAEFPTPFLEFSLLGAVTLVGMGWLVIATIRPGRYHDVAAGIAGTVAGCYLWYLLSQVFLLAHTTLLAFRVGTVLTAALLAAAAMALLELLPGLVRRTTPDWHRPARVLAALLAVSVLAATLQDFPDARDEKIDQAHRDYYPTGATAEGTSDPDDGGSWTPRLNAAIREMTGRPPNRNVLLGGGNLLQNTLPYWRFQAYKPQYANPLGRYPYRNTLIRRWSRSPDAAALAARLRRSPIVPPSVFVFRDRGRQLVLEIGVDRFPQNPTSEQVPVRFGRQLFAGPGFRVRELGPYVVAVRTRAGPRIAAAKE